VRYPATWRVTERATGLSLELTPRLPDQELDVEPRYWEGAVAIRGSEGGRPIAGDGYVELVGYSRAISARGSAR
jgi:predicted secreted hydrolase